MSSEINVIVHCAREYITSSPFFFFFLLHNLAAADAEESFRAEGEASKADRKVALKKQKVREAVNRLVTIICIV